MDPIGSSTTAPVREVAPPQAAPLPSAPAAPAARLADRPPAEEPVEPPPLPVALQRENMRPPEPALISREQMVALLNAAVGAVGIPTTPKG